MFKEISEIKSTADRCKSIHRAIFDAVKDQNSEKIDNFINEICLEKDTSEKPLKNFFKSGNVNYGFWAYNYLLFSGAVV